MKPVRGSVAPNFFGGEASGEDVPVLILPIEDGNVGGLEPWMVEYIRDPHPDCLPDGMKKTQLAASHAISAAIDAILKEAEK